jgi:hypothetical protein
MYGRQLARHTATATRKTMTRTAGRTDGSSILHRRDRGDASWIRFSPRLSLAVEPPNDLICKLLLQIKLTLGEGPDGPVTIQHHTVHGQSILKIGTLYKLLQIM